MGRATLRDTRALAAPAQAESKDHALFLSGLFLEHCNLARAAPEFRCGSIMARNRAVDCSLVIGGEEDVAPDQFLAAEAIEQIFGHPNPPRDSLQGRNNSTDFARRGGRLGVV